MESAFVVSNSINKVEANALAFAVGKIYQHLKPTTDVKDLQRQV